MTSAALVVLTLVVGLAPIVSNSVAGDQVPSGMSRELDSHRAESIKVAQRTQQHLDEASAALAAGRAEAAAASLDEASRKVRQVRPQDGRHALQNRHRELKSELRRAKASPSQHVRPPAASTTESPRPRVVPAADRETAPSRGGPSPDTTPAREHEAVNRPTGQATSIPDLHETSTSSIPTAPERADSGAAMLDGRPDSRSSRAPSRTDAPSTPGRQYTPPAEDATDRTPRKNNTVDRRGEHRYRTHTDDRRGHRHSDDRTADKPGPKSEETTPRRSDLRGDIQRPDGDDDVAHRRSGHHEPGHQRGTDR